MAPPPMAVTTRPTMNDGRLGANGSQIEPSMNRPSAATKTLRRPNRSLSLPMKGMTAT